MVYLITYDLRVPGQNYLGLHQRIKFVCPNWIKPCESFWLVSTTLTAEQLANRLNEIDATDKLIVLAVKQPGHVKGISDSDLNWMSNNIQ